MEIVRGSYQPFEQRVQTLREKLQLRPLTLPMDQGCEAAFVEAERIVKELGLPGVGPESLMYGILREWRGVQHVYDLEREARYPERSKIESYARSRLSQLVPVIRVTWNVQKGEGTVVDEPGIDEIARLVGIAERSAIAQRFPMITTFNLFEILVMNNSGARTVATVGGADYRKLVKTFPTYTEKSKS